MQKARTVLYTLMPPAIDSARRRGAVAIAREFELAWRDTVRARLDVPCWKGGFVEVRMYACLKHLSQSTYTHESGVCDP